MNPATAAIFAGTAALLALYLVNRASGAAGRAWDGAAGVAGAAWDGFAGGVSGAADFVGHHAGTTFNPASDQNIVYRSVNAVGGVIADDDSWSLGGWLYDVFNPEPTPAPAPPGSWAWYDLPDVRPYQGGGASGSW